MLTSPSAGCTSSTRPATSEPVPDGASSSHSPGPEPTTSVPCSSRAACPNRTPRSPSVVASTSTLASGVQSMRRSSAPVRRTLTTQPFCTVTGGTGEIGLLATGKASATLAPPLGVEVGVMPHHPSGDAFTVRQLHRNRRLGFDEVGGDEAEADGASQRGRHPARGDPAGDSVLALHYLAGFGRND